MTVANLNPRGMVGRICLANHFHCYIINIEAVCFMDSLRIFLTVFPQIKSIEANDLSGCGRFGPHGHG